jgi:hypothetical protein
VSAYRTPSPPPAEPRPPRDWRIIAARAWLAGLNSVAAGLLAWGCVKEVRIAWFLLAIVAIFAICGALWLTLWALGVVVAGDARGDND